MIRFAYIKKLKLYKIQVLIVTEVGNFTLRCPREGLGDQSPLKF